MEVGVKVLLSAGQHCPATHPSREANPKKLGKERELRLNG